MSSDKINKTSISTWCDDLLLMPCNSKINSKHDNLNSHDVKFVVENNLREQVIKLNKSLESCFKGKGTLDKILSEQRC